MVDSARKAICEQALQGCVATGKYATTCHSQEAVLAEKFVNV
jgi:hypothetical protein